MEEVEATAETLGALKRARRAPGRRRLRHRLLVAQLPEALPGRRCSRSTGPSSTGLGTDPEDAAIVTAIVSLAQALRLEVVAEGVEHAHQLGILRRLGCDAVQGYLFGPPRPPGDLIREASPFVLALA